MQKKKIEGYFRALRLMNDPNLKKTQVEACKIAKISRMTFNKYREMFGDEIKPGMFEVPLPESKSVPAPKAVPVEATGTSDLERLLQENAALQEQLKLRQELAKYVH